MTTKSQVPVFRHIVISQKGMKIFSKHVGFSTIKQFKNELHHNEKAEWWFKKIYFWNIMYVQLYIWYCLFCSGSRAVLSAETMFEASKLGRSSSKASPMPSPLGPPSSSTVSSLSLSGWSLSLGGQYDSYKAQVPVFRNSPPPPPEPMFRFSDTT